MWLMEHIKRLNKIQDSLKTGDLVLFSRKGRISSGIRFITHSKWSHIGMVVRNDHHNEPLLFESTIADNVCDVESQKRLKGVQLVTLRERLSSYEGGVSVRLLVLERTEEMLDALHQFHDEVRGRPFEQKKAEFIRAAYDGPFGHNQEDLSSLFCSELIAEAYQRMGLLAEDKASNEYTPRDFSDKGRLSLLKGSLNNEIEIKVFEAVK